MQKVKNKNRVIYLITALLFLVGGYLAYMIYDNINFSDVPNSEVIKEEEKDMAFRHLDGVLVEKGSENFLPIAIMIENHVASRPQSNLSKASVVYEVLTESYITRFLAIYDLSQEMEEIGPVRSARPYFIDLASEYGALYVHSGGSPEALDRLENEEGVIDLNEFFGYNTDYFKRDSSRYAPHNLYTSSENLKRVLEDYELNDQGEFIVWKFKDDETPSVYDEMIRINYSQNNFAYQVIWKYDTEDNNYKRFQNDAPHLNRDGESIYVKNIVVQFAKTKVIDNIGRKEIDVGSEGEAKFFVDGSEISGTWKKEEGRTIFYDENGDEIEFNRGSIWIEIVPDDMEIVIE